MTRSSRLRRHRCRRLIPLRQARQVCLKPKHLTDWGLVSVDKSSHPLRALRRRAVASHVPVVCQLGLVLASHQDYLPHQRRHQRRSAVLRYFLVVQGLELSAQHRGPTNHVMHLLKATCTPEIKGCSTSKGESHSVRRWHFRNMQCLSSSRHAGRLCLKSW